MKKITESHGSKQYLHGTDKENRFAFTTKEERFYTVEHEPIENCPLCGGAAEIAGDNEGRDIFFTIKCKKCGCSLSSKSLHEWQFLHVPYAVNKLIDKWNSRNGLTVEDGKREAKTS